MAKEKNYYALLGVSRSATAEDIRSAFRKLAKERHPDLIGDEGTAFFQKIIEAYTVLSDPESRECYDESLRRAEKREVEAKLRQAAHRIRAAYFRPATLSRGGIGRGSILDSLFEDLQGAFPDEFREEALDIELILTPAEAARGGVVSIPVSHSCPLCHGSGYTGLFRCMYCRGRGSIGSEDTVPVRIAKNVKNGTVMDIRYHDALLRIHIRIGSE